MKKKKKKKIDTKRCEAPKSMYINCRPEKGETELYFMLEIPVTSPFFRLKG